jgi:hypothetical protein
VVGKGLYASDTTKVWFANLGHHPTTIRKGTKIATAQHVSSMDEITELPINHTAGGGGKAEMFSCVPKKSTDKTTMGKLKTLYSTPHWSTYVKQYAFPAVLMDPTDRPLPLVETSDSADIFDVSEDFGEPARKIVMQTSRASSSSELELRARAGSNVHIFVLEQLEHKRVGLELSSTSPELSRKNEVPPVAAAPSSTAQLRGPRHPSPQLPPRPLAAQ